MTKVTPSVYKTEAWKRLKKEIGTPPEIRIKPVDWNNKDEQMKAKQMEKLINYMYKNNTNGITTKFHQFVKEQAQKFFREEVMGIKTNWDVMDRTINSMAKELGKRGGKATLTKLGSEHFERISKLGVQARKHEKNTINKK